MRVRVDATNVLASTHFGRCYLRFSIFVSTPWISPLLRYTPVAEGIVRSGRHDKWSMGHCDMYPNLGSAQQRSIPLCADDIPPSINASLTFFASSPGVACTPSTLRRPLLVAIHSVDHFCPGVLAYRGLLNVLH